MIRYADKMDLFELAGEGIDEPFLFGLESIDEVLLMLAISTSDRSRRGG